MNSFKTQLYDHQRAAVEKLSRVKVGALYMEQGTGKTRTTLELIKMRMDVGKVDKAIWLCPCSVKQNLRNDIIYHCGEMPDNITICGIETLSTSVKWISKLMNIAGENTYLIVDESILVKNSNAIRTQRIINISQKCKYKLILNGTPVSKYEADLFAQWYILDWRILGYQSFYSFAANHLEYDEYGKIRKSLNVEYLAEKMVPFTYQILKSECLSLPPKTYQYHWFGLTDQQERHYELKKDMYMDAVDEFNETTIYRLLTALQLILSGERITSEKPSEHIIHERMFGSIYDNPRIQALMNVVSSISEKCIIYCKYSQSINDVCGVLNNEYGPETAVPFDGTITIKKRVKNLERFSTSSRFLVANKRCAGYGLNLQFCHYVVYYENDFDWATRAQSEDRVHRIGQNQNVCIIDICCGKLDKMIINCLSKKENIANKLKKEIHNKRNEEEVKYSDKNRIVTKRKTENHI